MVKKKKPLSSKQPEVPSFEEALAVLQEIVNELEQGTIGLEESMQRFETGVTLLRTCYEILETAEQRIEVLTGVDAEGNPITAEYDATATAAGTEPEVGKRKPAAKKSARKQSDEQSTANPDPNADSTLF